MNKPEWALTLSDLKNAEKQGILDYGNNKMYNNKKVPLYQCKWEAIEKASRNKILKYLGGECSAHPSLLETKYLNRAHCIFCLQDILKYMKEEK